MRLIMLLLLAATAGCSSIRTCFPKERPDLVGEWRWLGHIEEGVPDRFCPPHPVTLLLRADGTYAARFADENAAGPEEHGRTSASGHETPGIWRVQWFCAEDLFLPRQWLQMRPGMQYQSFSIAGGHLTMHYPGGSGICDERYQREPEN